MIPMPIKIKVEGQVLTPIVDFFETIHSSLTDCKVGSRKRRNIRDNLFVINAITNEAKQKKQKKHVMSVYMT